MLVDLLGGADLLDPPQVEHGHPVGHAKRLVLVVGDEDEGDADLALQRLELALHLLAQLEVEGAQGLVEQEHLGLEHQRPGQGHALALAARELCGPPRAVLGQGHQLQHPCAFLWRSALATPRTIRP